MVLAAGCGGKGGGGGAGDTGCCDGECGDPQREAADADVILYGVTSGGGLGYAMAWVGDVDGDGLDDRWEGVGGADRVERSHDRYAAAARLLLLDP